MNNTTFRDFTLILVLAFVIMVVWMLPHINPRATDSNSEPPGNVIAQITWPPGDTDVDLWVDGPGEVRPVGYSNKGGLLWNLLRDDLGMMPDLSGVNYENAFTRGIAAGEYVVNVHCYRCPIVPVPVSVEISVKWKAALKVVARTNVTLGRNGEELTALRFKLTKDGKVVKGSMGHFYEPLRSRGMDQ